MKFQNNNKNLQKTWDKSFINSDNFLLYPNEHLIRFVNKFVLKRSAINISKNKKKCLDLGCGSGRHIIYLSENGFHVTGLDISKEAIRQSKILLNYRKIKDNTIKFLQSSSSKMNFKKNNFDFIVSHGTLDSMFSSDSYKTIKEAHRILKIGGLFYVDLISDRVKNKGKFVNSYDQIISAKHEHKTIQSYFNIKRINNNFKIFKSIEIYKVTIKENKKLIDERFHCVFKKI